MRILVTGATGFIGRHVVAQLDARGYSYRLTSRRPVNKNGVDWQVAPGPTDYQAWCRLAAGMDAIIHLAGRAHNRNETLDNQRLHNTTLTECLATAAAAQGARHFIYISTIKVLGEKNPTDPQGHAIPFRESNQPDPRDPYAQSKLDAECAVAAAAKGLGMATTVIRPPLVYGPGVRANFLQLMKYVARGWPLPLGAIDNQRSFVAAANLADLILTCLQNLAAAGETFLVSDLTVSTPKLVRLLAKHMHKKPRLVSVPPSMLRTAGIMLGRKAMIERLTDSLVVDSAHVLETLNWQPRQSPDEALAATVDWFLAMPDDEAMPEFLP
jgi:nucleoside-diphosphate-sugar epimerase